MQDAVRSAPHFHLNVGWTRTGQGLQPSNNIERRRLRRSYAARCCGRRRAVTLRGEVCLHMTVAALVVRRCSSNPKSTRFVDMSQIERSRPAAVALHHILIREILSPSHTGTELLSPCRQELNSKHRIAASSASPSASASRRQPISYATRSYPSSAVPQPPMRLFRDSYLLHQCCFFQVPQYSSDYKRRLRAKKRVAQCRGIRENRV